MKKMTDEQNNSREQVVDIDSLRQDTHNFNRGTEEGQQLMERSFKELGAGRSILLDREGNIIAGNKSQEAARKAGIKRVRIVETTGDELVAVKRTDIDIDSAEGRRMALLDNLTTQVNLAWDPSEIEAVSSEIDGFDPTDYGFDPSQLEVAGIGDEPTEAADERDTAEKPERKRDPDSEIIVATVSLFGTTEDMMLTQQLTTEEADKLIRLAKQEGAGNLMKRIIDAL